MKILYSGNIANIGYSVTKQLRKKGIEIDLLMEKNPIVEQDPVRQDPELDNTYPNWIKFYEKNSAGWKRGIIKLMKSYDLIASQYEHNIFAYFARKPIVSQIVGDDLRELALSSSIRGFLLRRALRKAKAVLYSTPAEFSLLSRLKIKNKIFLPLFSDLQFFRPIQVNRDEFVDKLVVFHPTNLWSLKGNAILVEGFTEFVKNNRDSILIMIDRGPDSGKIHELVEKLGISKSVHFLKGPLDSVTLRNYYNTSDIVADQFIVPEIGGIGREAFCCQKPLLTRYEGEEYKKFYGEVPPAMNASNKDEIREKLEYLKDPNIREELGKRGRDWACKHYSPDGYSKRLIAIYEGVLNGQKIDKIQENITKI